MRGAENFNLKENLFKAGLQYAYTIGTIDIYGWWKFTEAPWVLWVTQKNACQGIIIHIAAITKTVGLYNFWCCFHYCFSRSIVVSYRFQANVKTVTRTAPNLWSLLIHLSRQIKIIVYWLLWPFSFSVSDHSLSVATAGQWLKEANIRLRMKFLEARSTIYICLTSFPLNEGFIGSVSLFQTQTHTHNRLCRRGGHKGDRSACIINYYLSICLCLCGRLRGLGGGGDPRLSKHTGKFQLVSNASLHHCSHW